MTSEIVCVTDDNFEKEVLKSNLPVMVDLWAEWCPPCKMIAPIIEGLSRDYKNKLKVAKLDVDANSQVATELGVMNIPTVIFFKNGKEHRRIIGANPKKVFEDAIKELIGS